MQDIFQIYLPIAGTSINIFILIGIGLAVGLLSGMFGIGGGMVGVPVLVFIGIPAQVAIATSANQMIASSFSGYLVYAKRSLVDYKLSCVLLIGSVFGTLLGILLFSFLSFLGQADLFVSISLAITLSTVAFFFAKDAVKIIYYKYKKITLPASQTSNIPKYITLFKLHFPSIQQSVSVLIPIFIGLVGGFVFSFVGVGGSLIMLPMVLHILGVIPNYAVGTLQFQMIFTAILTTTLHALTSQSLDIVLSIALIIGAAFGTHIGAKISKKFNKETFKVLLGFLVMIMFLKVIMSLFMMPKSLYHIEFLRQ